jgi:nucleoside-diphosphate-sugar epimerase
MKVFITGASGYIGSAVAETFTRAGHDVVGLVRSNEKAARLAAAEGRPVIGSMQEPASYSAAARDSQVLIHCAAEYSAEYMNLDRRTVDALLESAAQSGGPRLLIYTSGVWVYGNTGGDMVDESAEMTPPAFIGRRIEHENRILDATQGRIRTLVVRPGCVYGGRGGLTASWFESAEKDGAVRMIGEGGNRWAMIHVADLANLYLRAAESPWGGEIFNATDRSRFTVRECAEAASRAAGAGGHTKSLPLEEALQTIGPMAEGLSLDQHVDSSKAVRMLNWQPRHGGFVDGVSRYYSAWKAAR